MNFPLGRKRSTLLKIETMWRSNGSVEVVNLTTASQNRRGKAQIQRMYTMKFIVKLTFWTSRLTTTRNQPRTATITHTRHKIRKVSRRSTSSSSQRISDSTYLAEIRSYKIFGLNLRKEVLYHMGHWSFYLSSTELLTYLSNSNICWLLFQYFLFESLILWNSLLTWFNKTFSLVKSKIRKILINERCIRTLILLTLINKSDFLNAKPWLYWLWWTCTTTQNLPQN